MTAPFPCLICGRDYELLDGDNGFGTASQNKHFAETPGHDTQTFEVAEPTDG